MQWMPKRLRQERVARRWSEVIQTDAFSSSVYWLAVPEVQAHFQKRAVNGQPYPTWIDYVLAEYVKDPLPVERILSLGCGSGSLERDLARRGVFQRCDAYDIAPGAIELAKSAAAAENMAHIHYQAADITNYPFPDACYDLAWFNGSLHHIEELDATLSSVRRALKPDGLLILNEYVGPDRFDFTDRQKGVMRACFELIPPHLRRNFDAINPNEFQLSVSIPDPVAVSAADPSEAVRSSAILGALDQHFEVLACNDAGGTILQFLLSGIAGNFRSDDPQSIAVLNMLFAIEDTLIDVGDLSSDFVIVVAKRRG